MLQNKAAEELVRRAVEKAATMPASVVKFTEGVPGVAVVHAKTATALLFGPADTDDR